jgi:hypothetical protein
MLNEVNRMSIEQPYNEPEEFQLAPFSKQTTHGKFVPDKEPCEWCDEIFFWHKNRKSLDVEYFPHKYCPNCGRKVD